MTTPDILTSKDFAAKIRAKYPGSYDSVSDDELTSRIVQKYPEYKSQVDVGLSSSTRQAIRDNPPKFPEEKSLNQIALSGMTGIPSPSFSPQQRQRFEQGRAAGSLATPGGGLVTAGSGVVDVAQGEYAKGGHKIISGGMTAAMPLMPEAVVARPLMALRAIGGGIIGSKLSEAGFKAMGASEDQQKLASDIGGIAGGGAAATGLLRAFLESPTKALLGKIATSGAIDPEVTGLISPRLAHLQKLLINAGKIANKTTAQPETVVGTSELAAAPAKEPTLPNATYLQDNARVLPGAKTRLPESINKDTNTLSQDYFIQKMRSQLETPTVSGETEQLANLQRMLDYAKKPVDRAQVAYRTRNAGETGIMPRGKAQASLDPNRVSEYMEGRGTAENHPQELVKIDLSKLDPSEYEIMPNGYVKFKSAVPESFIEKMGSKALADMQPGVPTSDIDLMNRLTESIRRAQARK